ncbi:hypothetical protein EJ08DRAFT_681391 [Tothia fuscella]|uniref:Uncharacterized protein n=1 Tax=Tothia fuscella TaxID=1048955 RepID=A0A9P4TVV8_9PEZI|nr:hypothetical protein EJ08DRAFT_681391 [Tothia fuscella]
MFFQPSPFVSMAILLIAASAEFIPTHSQTRRQNSNQLPDKLCGRIGWESGAAPGLPQRPILAKCQEASICATDNPDCTIDCPSHCIPKPACNSRTPCATGFICTILQGVFDLSGKQQSACERVPASSKDFNMTSAGQKCGMNHPDCGDSRLICQNTDPACYSSDVCPAVCKKRPVPPPPKYPSCGGFRMNPGKCPAPNMCVNDPSHGPACGMSCDAPGICVKLITCGGALSSVCPEDTKCVQDPRIGGCDGLTGRGPYCSASPGSIGGICV